MSIPGYWPNETSGVLKPVVTKYLAGLTLEPEEVATMGSYLRQWVNGSMFGGPEVKELRRLADTLQTTEDVQEWLRRALDAGIDPL